MEKDQVPNNTLSYIFNMREHLDIVCYTPDEKRPQQKFLFDGKHIISALNGQVMDVCGESKKKGTRVIIYPYVIITL